jgi:hypothetical protein
MPIEVRVPLDLGAPLPAIDALYVDGYLGKAKTYFNDDLTQTHQISGCGGKTYHFIYLRQAESTLELLITSTGPLVFRGPLLVVASGVTGWLDDVNGLDRDYINAYLAR